MDDINIDEDSSWWQKRINRKRLYYAFFVILIMTFISLVLLAFTDTNELEICNSQQCVRTSNIIFDNIKPVESPCDNFNEFSCGYFLNHTNKPTERIEAMDAIKMNIHEQLNDIFKEDVKQFDPKYLNIVKRYYRACMNESALEKEGLKRMKGILRDMGGWPVIEGITWRGNSFNWIAAVHKLRRIGFEFQDIIDISVVLNKKEPAKYILQISSPFLRIREDEEEIIYYNNLMTDIAVLFGADRNRAEREHLEVSEFKNKLSEISDGKPLHQTNYITVTKLQRLFPSVPWFEYLNGILYPSAKITYEEEVNVSELDYIAKLETILHTTPTRTISNYICWNFVEKYLAALPTKVTNLKYDHHIEENKSPRKLERWEICINTVYDKFNIPASAAYLKQHLTHQLKNAIESLIQIIIEEYKTVITELPWMDAISADIAIKKFDDMKIYIGGIKELYNENLINEIYDSIDLQESQFLLATLNIDFTNVNTKYEKLHQSPRDHLWTEQVFVLENYLKYDVELNTLFLPAAIIQGLYYHIDRPQYMNYGALGYLIAHEVSHMFIEGKKISEYGKTYKWWTPYTTTRYNRLLRCISEQHYSIFNIFNGNRSENLKWDPKENIADIAGAKISYGAYNRWVYVNGAEYALPGLNYTPNQLFWISLGQSMCSRQIPHEKITKEPLIPNGIRVLGSLRNLNDFSTDFNCPENSFMNPNAKCTIF